MQYSQEHLKTMVYAKFGGQTECIMGNWKIENESWAPDGRLYGGRDNGSGGGGGRGKFIPQHRRTCKIS